MLKNLYGNKNNKIYGVNAAKIVYCLMAVDGDISKPEKKEFEKIVEAFGVYSGYEINELKEKCEKILKNKNRIFEKMCEIVEEEIKDGEGRGNINQSLLIWNMMTIALSDNDYSENEIELIKFVADKLNLDEMIYIEIDNAIKALYSITNEKQWLEIADISDERKKQLKFNLEERMNTIKKSVSTYLEMEL